MCIPTEKWSQIINAGEKSSDGIKMSSHSIQDFKESQYNLLAETLRKHLDMKKIYEIMGTRESS